MPIISTFRHEWTEEEKMRLVNFIDENRSRKNRITKLFQEFISLYDSDGNMSKEEVMVMYNRTKKEIKEHNSFLRVGHWHDYEDEIIKEVILEKYGKESMKNIFELLCEILERSPENIRNHYENSICQKEENKAYLDQLKECINKSKNENDEILFNGPYAINTLIDIPTEELKAISVATEHILRVKYIKEYEKLFSDGPYSPKALDEFPIEKLKAINAATHYIYEEKRINDYFLEKLKGLERFEKLKDPEEKKIIINRR